jgi:hypothetical protein
VQTLTATTPRPPGSPIWQRQPGLARGKRPKSLHRTCVTWVATRQMHASNHTSTDRLRGFRRSKDTLAPSWCAGGSSLKTNYMALMNLAGSEACRNCTTTPPTRCLRRTALLLPTLGLGLGPDRNDTVLWSSLSSCNNLLKRLDRSSSSQCATPLQRIFTCRHGSRI